MVSDHMKLLRSGTTASQSLTFFIPALEEWLSAKMPLPASLRRILKSAAFSPLTPDACLGQLLMGLPMGAAPALANEHPLAPEAASPWVVASPLTLTPDINAVWAEPIRDPLPERVYQALQGFFEDYGYVTRWLGGCDLYLKLAQMPDVRFSPLESLAGVSLDACMPEGRDAKHWQMMMSEAQILMHNLERGVLNQVNTGLGLWFWGLGQMPTMRSEWEVDSVVTAHDTLEHLARFLDIKTCSWHCVPNKIEGQDILIEWPIDIGIEGVAGDKTLAEWLGQALMRLRLGRLKTLRVASRGGLWSLSRRAIWFGQRQSQ